MSIVRPPEFDPKWRRQKRWRARWHALRPWLAVAAIIAAGVWFSGLPSFQGEATPVEQRFTLCGEKGSAACVIDGDTVAIGKRRIRLSGYDAPELDGECETEKSKAREARSALQTWLNSASFLLDGGEEPPLDQYGRELRGARRVLPDGGDEWLADHMVRNGLAEDSGWGSSPIDWCRQG